MASKRDMRRPDLIVPYQPPPPKTDSTEFSSTLSSTLPMAAMITRNRFIGWASMVFALQTWLGESEDSRKNAATPGYFSVGMAFMSLAVSYIPMFLPPTGGANKASGTGPAAPVPLAT